MAARAHPVDQCPDILVDRHVCASRELRVRRQPRRKRSVRQDELALRKGRPQRLGESREPGLARAVLIGVTHDSGLLPVDVNPVQVVVENELRHRSCERRGVEPARRRLVGLTEGGRDDVDARRSVLGLLRRLLGSGEVGVGGSLVKGSVEGKE